MKSCFFKIFLCIAALFTGISVEAKTLNFAVASDIHYTKENAGQKSIGEKALNGFIDRVNENKYDFVIFLGDNIDKSNQESLTNFLKIAKKVKTPYYLVMGNHDVHKISGLDKKEYIKIVSKQNKYQRNKKASYYFYPKSDVIVIVLDGVSSGLPSNHGVFTQKTLKWLDETLTQNENKAAIIFQHVPLIEPYPDRTHNILEQEDYKATIHRHKNVVMVCSGHYHASHKYGYKKDEKNVHHVSVPALFKEPYNYSDITVDYKHKLFSKPSDFKIDVQQKPAI